jgi:hypothetical protein
MGVTPFGADRNRRSIGAAGLPAAASCRKLRDGLQNLPPAVAEVGATLAFAVRL